MSRLDALVIKTVSEAEAAAKGLLENLQREELDPIEEAEGFSNLYKLDPGYWTQEKIASLKGKDQTYVSRSLALLELPEDIIESMRHRIISRDHGIELLRLSNTKLQKRIAAKVGKKGLSSKKTREIVDAALGIKNTEKTIEKDSFSPSIVDPMADLWQGIMADPAIANPGSFLISFGPPPHAPGAKAILLDGWNFWVSDQTEDPLSAITDWFRKMADALEVRRSQRAAPGGTAYPAA